MCCALLCMRSDHGRLLPVHCIHPPTVQSMSALVCHRTPFPPAQCPVRARCQDTLTHLQTSCMGASCTHASNTAKVAVHGELFFVPIPVHCAHALCSVCAWPHQTLHASILCGVSVDCQMPETSRQLTAFRRSSARHIATSFSTSPPSLKSTYTRGSTDIAFQAGNGANQRLPRHL